MVIGFVIISLCLVPSCRTTHRNILCVLRDLCKYKALPWVEHCVHRRISSTLKVPIRVWEGVISVYFRTTAVIDPSVASRTKMMSLRLYYECIMRVYRLCACFNQQTHAHSHPDFINIVTSEIIKCFHLWTNSQTFNIFKRLYVTFHI